MQSHEVEQDAGRLASAVHPVVRVTQLAAESIDAPPGVIGSLEDRLTNLPSDGWADRIADARAFVAALGSIDAAAEQLRRLAPDGDAVEPLIPLLHGRGYSQREIAARPGLSQSTVSRRLKILVSLGLSDPIDPSFGGGASAQMKAARTYRLAAQDLIGAGLGQTASHERDFVYELIASLHAEATEELDHMRTNFGAQDRPLPRVSPRPSSHSSEKNRCAHSE